MSPRTGGKKTWADLVKPDDVVEAVSHLRTREDVDAAASATLIETVIKTRITQPELRAELLAKVRSLSGPERR